MTSRKFPTSIDQPVCDPRWNGLGPLSLPDFTTVIVRKRFIIHHAIILNTPLLPLIFTIYYKTIDPILWDCWTFYVCAAEQLDAVNDKEFQTVREHEDVMQIVPSTHRISGISLRYWAPIAQL